MQGIGPVQMAILMGFVFGYFTASSRTTSGSITIQIIAAICLPMGIMAMFATPSIG